MDYVPENLDDQISQLRTIRNRYLAALMADAIKPQASYSFDGQSVDRVGWRESTMKLVTDINVTLGLLDPFEIQTVQQ